MGLYRRSTRSRLRQYFCLLGRVWEYIEKPATLHKSEKLYSLQNKYLNPQRREHPSVWDYAQGKQEIVSHSDGHCPFQIYIYIFTFCEYIVEHHKASYAKLHIQLLYARTSKTGQICMTIKR